MGDIENLLANAEAGEGTSDNKTVGPSWVTPEMLRTYTLNMQEQERKAAEATTVDIRVFAMGKAVEALCTDPGYDFEMMDVCEVATQIYHWVTTGRYLPREVAQKKAGTEDYRR